MCTDILNIKTSNQLIPLSCTKLRNQPEQAEQPRSDLSKSEQAKATQSHLQRVRASNQPIGNLQTKLCIYSSFYILYNKVEKSKCVIFLSFYYLLELAKQPVCIFSTFVSEENSLSGYQIILILALLESGVGDKMLNITSQSHM